MQRKGKGGSAMSITAFVLFMRIKRKHSGCVGMTERKRSVCVGITKRFGNVACDVNVTHTLRVLFCDRYCRKKESLPIIFVYCCLVNAFFFNKFISTPGHIVGTPKFLHCLAR